MLRGVCDNVCVCWVECECVGRESKCMSVGCVFVQECVLGDGCGRGWEENVGMCVFIREGECGVKIVCMSISTKSTCPINNM
jgi:hypothetical protein